MREHFNRCEVISHACQQTEEKYNKTAGKPFVSYFQLQSMKPNLWGWSALSKFLKALSRVLLWHEYFAFPIFKWMMRDGNPIGEL